ncbi:MAG: nucleotide exchange factor GrpE [Elusimicrobia bacterium]|nr:nucleotide exchange factor GrpE [Elusimicrobiota bacterium]
MTEKRNNEELYREAKVSELEILKQSLEEYKASVKEYSDQLLYQKADFANYRRRVEKEKREFFEDGKNSLIMELIDVFETVKLAKDMIEKAKDSESIHKGLHHIEKKLEDILKQHKVIQIATVGEKSDPHFHDIVGVVEKENVEEGIILEEVKAGYKIGNKVLKPAMVRTAKQHKKKDEG